MNTKSILPLVGLIVLSLTLGLSPMVTAGPRAAVIQAGQQSMPSAQAGASAPPALAPMTPLSPTQSSDAAIYISPIALSKVQQLLSQKGFSAGSADGIWGRSTASALKRFQESVHLAPTGNIDIETIQALGAAEILNSNATGLTSPPQIVGPGARLYISPSVVRDIQQTLEAKGIDVGNVDGVWGDKTRQAIRDFQRRNGMVPTGHADLALLDHCGMAKDLAALGLGSTAPEQMVGQQQPGAASPVARGYYGDKGRMQRAMPTGQVNAMMPATPQGRGAALYAGPAMIRRVQSALSAAGFDPGLADGHWRDTTADALREYQITQNLPPTGRLTLVSMQKLLGVGMDSSYTSGSRSGMDRHKGRGATDNQTTNGMMNSNSNGNSMMNGQTSGMMSNGGGQNKNGMMNNGRQSDDK